MTPPPLAQKQKYSPSSNTNVTSSHTTLSAIAPSLSSTVNLSPQLHHSIPFVKATPSHRPSLRTSYLSLFYANNFASSKTMTMIIKSTSPPPFSATTSSAASQHKSLKPSFVNYVSLPTHPTTPSTLQSTAAQELHSIPILIAHPLLLQTLLLMPSTKHLQHASSSLTLKLHSSLRPSHPCTPIAPIATPLASPTPVQPRLPTISRTSQTPTA